MTVAVTIAERGPADENALREDYPFAVAHLATHFRKNQERPQLLLAWVELLPRGFPKPSSIGPDAHSLSGRAGGRIFHSRIAMSGADAMAWYQAASRNALMTPAAMEPGFDDRRGIPVSTRLARQDPSWPRLGLMGDDPDATMRFDIPFLADWHDQPRVHRVFAAPDEELAAIATRPDAANWLRSRLHVDFSLHPEWLGGLALVAPNPLWSRKHQRLAPAGDGHPERSLLRLVPRPGVDLSGLTVIAYEERLGAIASIWKGRFGTSALMSFEHEQQVEGTGLLIHDDRRGLLLAEAPVHFVRRIVVSGSLQERKRRMSATLPGGGVDTFDIPDFSDFDWSQGAEAADDAVKAAAGRRGRRSAGDVLNQRWFGSDAAAAVTFVRSLIMGARRSVQIYDPYATGLELFRFLLAVTRRTVSVRALTSNLPFKQPDATKRGEMLDLLEREVGRLIEYRGGASDVEVAVMRGQQPPLHDRFLAIDDEIWFTGNSLGTLGERAGMIIRLPDPAPVRRELDALYDHAEPWDAFVERRRVASAEEADEQ